MIGLIVTEFANKFHSLSQIDGARIQQPETQNGIGAQNGGIEGNRSKPVGENSGAGSPARRRGIPQGQSGGHQEVAQGNPRRHLKKQLQLLKRILFHSILISRAIINRELICPTIVKPFPNSPKANQVFLNTSLDIPWSICDHEAMISIEPLSIATNIRKLPVP